MTGFVVKKKRAAPRPGRKHQEEKRAWFGAEGGPEASLAQLHDAWWRVVQVAALLRCKKSDALACRDGCSVDEQLRPGQRPLALEQKAEWGERLRLTAT